jgi:hypothetical protein
MQTAACAVQASYTLKYQPAGVIKQSRLKLGTGNHHSNQGNNDVHSNMALLATWFF